MFVGNAGLCDMLSILFDICFRRT